MRLTAREVMYWRESRVWPRLPMMMPISGPERSMERTLFSASRVEFIVTSSFMASKTSLRKASAMPTTAGSEGPVGS